MFRFGEPTYLYLLLLLPFLAAFYLYSNYKRRKNIRRFGDPTLLAQLMPDVSKYRPDVKFWIIFVAIGLFSVLLARPQFGSKLETVKRKGVEVIIALDISNSMLAQDVQPSRLEKAKRLISRLVDELDNDKVGMIVFAGDAFTQLPITSDYISAKMFLESIKSICLPHLHLVDCRARNKITPTKPSPLLIPLISLLFCPDLTNRDSFLVAGNQHNTNKKGK